MNHILTAWRNLPTLWKGVVIGGILLLLLISNSTVGGIVSHIKDRAADAREAKKEAERQVLEDERNVAIGRAEASESREKDLRTQLTIHEISARAMSEQARQIAERLKEDDEKYVEEMRAVDVDVEYCDRIRRICARAKSLFPTRKPADECEACK